MFSPRVARKNGKSAFKRREEIDSAPAFSYNNGMGTLSFRENKGAAVCAVGIVCNLLLCAGKIAVGLIVGSVAVTADGFNNLSDCGGGVVALVSLFIAGKPADKKHPFGHRRAEYIAAMITAFFVLFLAAELVRESAQSIMQGGAPAGGLLVYLVLGVSVAVKLGMFALYRISATKFDSDALKAAATDSLCDSAATAAVIAGTALSAVVPSADGWAGVVVSLFIVWQGIEILAEASSKLLGQAPDPSLAERIKALLLSADGILGVHDLQIYNYGKGVSFATIHAEMDARLPMLDAHTVIDEMEMKVKKETGVLLTIHLDPVDLTNREESTLRLKIWEAARELAEGLELHDLRLVPGTDKVEFDVGVPYACKRTDSELYEALFGIVKDLGDYEPIIRIERE